MWSHRDHLHKDPDTGHYERFRCVLMAIQVCLGMSMDMVTVPLQ